MLEEMPARMMAEAPPPGRLTEKYERLLIVKCIARRREQGEVEILKMNINISFPLRIDERMRDGYRGKRVAVGGGPNLDASA
ncbi:MAG: hypothetical protein JRJ72_06750 [Deltaproteobacteria bacterium]|nr:hypothetical protein [Deltaproteobacteria bacterium]MBW2356650.1 hypothetical protein [Deltaproteobacteria bacterium]